MVDFANSNLCGASKELNDVLTKLADAKAEIENKLDDPASTAAAAFLASQNDLTALTAKLQTVVIPTAPRLNLQAEILGLLSQVPGSVGYAAALAKLSLEFKDDIEAKGLTLETLVSLSAAASDAICKVVPNLEKEAGSTEPAVEKPPAVKKPDKPAETEAPAKVNQNPAVETKTKEIEEKTIEYKVTETPPTEDTGAFTVSESTETVSVSQTETTGGGSTIRTSEPVKVSTPEPETNIANPKTDGFIHRTIRHSEKIKFENLKISGDKITITGLEEKPHMVLAISIYPGSNANFLVQPKDPRINASFNQPMTKDEYNKLNSIWIKANKPPYYESDFGNHWITILGNHYALEEDGPGLDEGTDPAKINSDGSVTVTSFQGVPDGNHPGNITSVPYLKIRKKNLDRKTNIYKSVYFYVNKGTGDPKGSTGYFFRNENRQTQKDIFLNRRYKGFAAQIDYLFMDSYDPNKKTT